MGTEQGAQGCRVRLPLPPGSESGRPGLRAGGEGAARLPRSLGPGRGLDAGCAELGPARAGGLPAAGHAAPARPAPRAPSIRRPSRLPRTLFSAMGSFSCSADITDREA